MVLIIFIKVFMKASCDNKLIGTNEKIDNFIILNEKKLDESNDKKRKKSFFLNPKLFDLLKDVSKKDIKFNFCDYLKSLVSSNEEMKNKIYKLAYDNLNDSLDVTNYFQLKQEVLLLKELILDDKQLLIFNSFSKVINFKFIFNDIIKNDFDFKVYEKNDYKNLFDSIKFIFERQSENDVKIMKFLNFTIQN